MPAEGNVGEFPPGTQSFGKKSLAIEGLGGATLAEIAGYHKNLAWVEPQIRRLKTHQTAGHQAGGDQQQHGNRHLRGNQKAPQPRAAQVPQGGSLILQSGREVSPREL